MGLSFYKDSAWKKVTQLEIVQRQLRLIGFSAGDKAGRRDSWHLEAVTQVNFLYNTKLFGILKEIFSIRDLRG